MKQKAKARFSSQEITKASGKCNNNVFSGGHVKCTFNQNSFVSFKKISSLICDLCGAMKYFRLQN